MSPRTIPLEDVREAVRFGGRRARLRVDALGKPLVRTAAYTWYPSMLPGCSARLAGHSVAPYGPRCTFGSMCRGDIARVLRRVYARGQGRAEVYATWGAGMREMISDLEWAVLR